MQILKKNNMGKSQRFSQAESHNNIFIINAKLYVKTHVIFDMEKDFEIY